MTNEFVRAVTDGTGINGGVGGTEMTSLVGEDGMLFKTLVK